MFGESPTGISYIFFFNFEIVSCVGVYYMERWAMGTGYYPSFLAAIPDHPRLVPDLLKKKT